MVDVLNRQIVANDITGRRVGVKVLCLLPERIVKALERRRQVLSHSPLDLLGLLDVTSATTSLVLRPLASRIIIQTWLHTDTLFDINLVIILLHLLMQVSLFIR